MCITGETLFAVTALLKGEVKIRKKKKERDKRTP